MNDLVVKRPPSWSLSAIGTFEKCQFRAKLRYVDRVPEKRGEAADRGIDFHKDIENFLKGASQSLPSPLDYYQGWFDEVKKYEIYPEYVIKLDENWQPAEENYWYKGVLDLLVVQRAAEHLLREPVREGCDNPEAEGRAEEVVQKVPPAKELIIYDWKTGRIYPEHDDQKSLYSRAAFAKFPSVLSVRAIHVYVDLRQIREKTFHRDEMHQLRTEWDGRAGKFLQALKDPEGMIPNPGFHCRWCPFSATKGGPCRF